MGLSRDEWRWVRMLVLAALPYLVGFWFGWMLFVVLPNLLSELGSCSADDNKQHSRDSRIEPALNDRINHFSDLREDVDAAPDALHIRAGLSGDVEAFNAVAPLGVGHDRTFGRVGPGAYARRNERHGNPDRLHELSDLDSNAGPRYGEAKHG